MKSKIFEPERRLVEFVKCYWTLESELENTPLKNTIVPDGTMKLIFHYGDTYKHHPKYGESVTLPKCFLIGQLTQPYIVEPLGVTGTFVVRFQPNGFLPFTTFAIKEMENTAIPLDQLFGKDGAVIGEKILNANSTSERIALIEAFLFNRLADKIEIDNIVKLTVETILNTKGQFSINELSKQSNISRRQLTRKFSSVIGLSPKQLSKTIRLQA